MIINHQDEGAPIGFPYFLDKSYYLFDIQGLVDNPVGSFSQRLLKHVLDRVGGHHHHCGLRPDLLDLLICLHPVHERHFDVHKDHVKGSLLDPFDGLRSVFRSSDSVSLALQDKGHGLAEADIIVYDEDIGLMLHAPFPLLPPRATLP